MALYEVTDLGVAILRPGVKASRRTVQAPTSWVDAVPAASYRVAEGEALAIVGESASGKSLMLMGALNMLSPGAKVVRGRTTFDGEVLQDTESAAWEQAGDRFFPELDRTDWREAVGIGIGILTQNPIGSWDPLGMIGEQSGEVLDEHFGLTQAEVEARVLDALGEVRLPRKRKFFSFPEQLSRGEAQRAMLAAALLSGPRLLLADEPLSGLDVSVASAILDLVDDMRRKRGMGLVLVTHDLAVVARVADRVAVVYGGSIVEEAPAIDLYRNPRHPYTAGLLASIPSLGRRLRPIPGDAPDLAELPGGCAFADRCEFVIPACRTELPPPRQVGAATVRCIRAAELDLPGVA